MANNQFKTGDTVRLNSGGPVMTVFKMTGDTVYCSYFDANIQEFKHTNFSADMLSHVKVI